MGDSTEPVTRVLDAVSAGEEHAAEKLLPLVYEELRKLAAQKMANEAPGQTLQPTALVHEAWLQLVGAEDRQFENRAHFFGAVAEAMHRILVENARRKQRLKQSGGHAQHQKLNLIPFTLTSPFGGFGDPFRCETGHYRIESA